MSMARVDQERVNDPAAGRLYSVARALTSALTADDVAAAVFRHALADLGAKSIGFWLLEEGVIGFAGGAGHVADVPARVGVIPLDSDLPAAMCVRTGEVVTYGSVAERDARWPALAGLESSSDAVVVLPLVARSRSMGCLHIGYTSPARSEDTDIGFLMRLAELCAAALDRAQLFDAEREHRGQLEFLAEATSVLIRSLEPHDVVQALVDIAVPRLADWCAVLTPDGDHLRPVALRLANDPGSVSEAVLHQSFTIAGNNAVGRCFRTGRTQVIDPIPTTGLRPEAADALRATVIDSAMLLPILLGGRPIGVLSLAFSGRPLTPRRRTTAEGLALRAGVALHNARMYDHERRTARTLAEALLPATTPVMPGYDCAVRYLPTAGDVAGDWYDVLDLGDRYLVGVGDAAGHGIASATLMAELRNAARGLAAAGLAPDQVLDTLATLVDRSGDELFATMLCGVLDPVCHELEWSTAGHPPPVLVRDGSARLLGAVDPETGTPIATGLMRRHSSQVLPVRRGDTLVLVTDGVFERRGGDLDEGLDRLLALLSAAAADRTEAIADRIVTELCGDATDDCSVLVLRRLA